jgi:hypothetical protein
LKKANIHLDVNIQTNKYEFWARSYAFQFSAMNYFYSVFKYEKNFEEIITGRTLCIHLNRTTPITNYMVIDIDSKGTSLHNLSKPWKMAVTLIGEEFQKDIIHFETLFSGTGLHYIFYTKKLYNIDKMRERVLLALKKQNKYLVNKKGTGNINFDMSPNYKGAMHISKFSLAKNGLIVQDIKKYGMTPDKYKIKL